VLLVGGSVYSDHAYENDVKIGARVEQCKTPAAVRAYIPPATNPSFEGFAGYLNRDGGWVESGRAVALLLGEITRLGARVVEGCKVSKLVQTDGRTTGVECEDGRTFGAEKIVLALGSWTASAFEAELGCGLETRCLATGWAQSVLSAASGC
jgi:sarcosine oxidase/L-pipecolate oxidase